MDRQQSYGDIPPTDELFQRLGELKRSVHQFTGGKWLWVIAALIVLL